MSGSSALEHLAEELRSDPVIAPHVRESDQPPALGLLAASGPRAAGAPAEYTLLFEAIREGFLLHYGTPRLIAGADPDLRLLAGDYLYALGLQRLAERGDLAAVRELGDLISLSAQLHATEDGAASAGAADALWVATAVAVGAGGRVEHEEAKEALRRGAPEGPRLLLREAEKRAREASMEDPLAAAIEQVGFAVQDPPDIG